MLQFVLQKIRNKKWMILSLLIGNLLLVGIVFSCPLYSQAILQRTLSRNLTDFLVSENVYPGDITIKSSASKSNADSGQQLLEVEALASSLPAQFDLDQVAMVGNFYLDNLSVLAEEKREDETNHVISMGMITDLPAHIRMVSGEMYADQPAADGTIDGIVSEAMMMKANLLVGERYTFESLSKNGKPVTVQICGVYEAAEQNDPYWVNTPNDLSKEILISEQVFLDQFLDYDAPQFTVKVRWDVLLDYTQMKGKQVSDQLAVCRSLERQIEKMKHTEISFAFAPILQQYEVQAKKLHVTLWVLQVPIFVLLAAFIFMVSQQMLSMEEAEIAIFKSRGASKQQIVWIYLEQSLLIAAAALVAGIPFGLLLCSMLGASNAFMEFVSRTALPLSFSWQAILFAVIASAFSVLAMVLPVLKYANVTIVMAKRKKQRRLKWSWWEKCGLDVILLGISLYGWFSFCQSKAYLAKQVADGASLDPLLFFSSSLFIVGAALLALRLFPYLVKLVFHLGKKWWNPAFYVSFRRIIHSKSQQGFIMVFLMMTISLGIFNSMSARTINSNAEDRIRYQNGADIVLQEQWQSNAMAVSSDDTGSKVLEYHEPDFNRYLSVDGVESATKVLVNEGLTMTSGQNNLKNVTVMGIDTKEFGQTAWMKNGLLDTHWYNYLNVLSMSADAVLVSSNARDQFGLQIGDTVAYNNREERWGMRGVIYGFVDYWPSFEPTETVVGEDGEAAEVNHYLVVANLQQMQASIGITPYQIWLKMEGSTQPIYDFAAEQHLTYLTFHDTYADLISNKNDPVIQGTNGVLTIGFIVVLLVCMVGFLIYWMLSIRSRQLQFGIFRAMGMSMKELLIMLVHEQLWLSGFSVLAGAIIGRVASVLFVPLMELSYASAEQIIPIEIVSRTSDHLRIAVVIGLMLASCLAILGWQIKRMNVSQALKLGED